MAISSDWLILPAQAGTMAVWTSLRSRRHQTRICSGHTDAGNWWAPPAVHTRRHEARDSSRPTHWDNGNRTYDVLSSFSRSTVIIIVDLQTSHRGSTLSLAFTMGSSCIQSKDSHTSKPWNPRWLLFAASPVVFFSISFMATSWVALRSIRFASLPGTSTWFKALNESKRPKCLCQKKTRPPFTYYLLNLLIASFLSTHQPTRSNQERDINPSPMCPSNPPWHLLVTRRRSGGFWPAWSSWNMLGLSWPCLHRSDSSVALPATRANSVEFLSKASDEGPWGVGH